MKHFVYQHRETLGQLAKSPVFMAALTHELQTYGIKSSCARGILNAYNSGKKQGAENAVRFAELIARFVRSYLNCSGASAPYKGIPPHTMRILANHGIRYAEDVIGAAMGPEDAVEWLPHAMERLTSTIMRELGPLAEEAAASMMG